jgi:hypothetical protein
MKAKNYLLTGLVMAGLLFTACESVLDESCSSENFKDDFNCSFDAIATFCSDGTSKAYYTYNGKKYECSGTDAGSCSTAIENLGKDLAQKGCGASKSGTIEAKLSAMAEQLLSEVRYNSLP